MSDLKMTLHQSPDHVVHKAETVVVDGDPYIVTDVKPVRESGVFLNWAQTIEPNIVVITIERFDGNPA